MPEQPKKASPIATAFGCLIALAVIVTVVIGIATSLYDEANKRGWVSHDSQMEVALGQGEWLVGEYRNCTTYPGSKFLECGIDPKDARAHLTDITFHGRIDRKDRSYFTWKCQRNNASFSCWALD